MSVGATPVIAIDGAAATGKSTLSRVLAQSYGFACFNTGAFYRAVAWTCLNQGLEVDDEACVVGAATSMRFDAVLDPQDEHFIVDGVDRSAEIRLPAVTAAVSKVSNYSAVRSKATERIRRLVQREVSTGFGIVLEGRDLTTVVVPDADVRILLVADATLRAARRAEVDEFSRVTERDLMDSRVATFLEPSKGVEVIDTGENDWETVIALAHSLIRRCTES